MSDFRVPCTNNGSEQELRMMKVQQKISGAFRSDTGPLAFCRIRGYFSTMAKQGHRLHGLPPALCWGSSLPYRCCIASFLLLGYRLMTL